MQSQARHAIVARLLGLALLIAPGNSWAAATWTVEAYTSSGVPLYAVSPGRDQVILDITLRTSDRALGIAGSVNDYDNSIVGLNAGASSIPSSVLNAICPPGPACFGGLPNQVGTLFPLAERAIGPGVEVEFLAGLSLSPAGGDGSLDPGIATGIAGDPQFRVVFDVIGIGSTTLQIGSFAEYLDGYTGTEDSLVNNTSVTIITGAIPEPSTALLIGIGLAGLAAARRS